MKEFLNIMNLYFIYKSIIKFRFIKDKFIGQQKWLPLVMINKDSQIFKDKFSIVSYVNVLLKTLSNVMDVAICSVDNASMIGSKEMRIFYFFI